MKCVFRIILILCFIIYYNGAVAYTEINDKSNPLLYVSIAIDAESAEVTREAVRLLKSIILHSNSFQFQHIHLCISYENVNSIDLLMNQINMFEIIDTITYSKRYVKPYAPTLNKLCAFDIHIPENAYLVYMDADLFVGQDPMAYIHSIVNPVNKNTDNHSGDPNTSFRKKMIYCGRPWNLFPLAVNYLEFFRVYNECELYHKEYTVSGPLDASTGLDDLYHSCMDRREKNYNRMNEEMVYLETISHGGITCLGMCNTGLYIIPGYLLDTFNSRIRSYMFAITNHHLKERRSSLSGKYEIFNISDTGIDSYVLWASTYHMQYHSRDEVEFMGVEILHPYMNYIVAAEDLLMRFVTPLVQQDDQMVNANAIDGGNSESVEILNHQPSNTIREEPIFFHFSLGSDLYVYMSTEYTQPLDFDAIPNELSLSETTDTSIPDGMDNSIYFEISRYFLGKEVDVTKCDIVARGQFAALHTEHFGLTVADWIQANIDCKSMLLGRISREDPLLVSFRSNVRTTRGSGKEDWEAQRYVSTAFAPLYSNVPVIEENISHHVCYLLDPVVFVVPVQEDSSMDRPVEDSTAANILPSYSGCLPHVLSTRSSETTHRWFENGQPMVSVKNSTISRISCTLRYNIPIELMCNIKALIDMHVKLVAQSDMTVTSDTIVQGEAITGRKWKDNYYFDYGVGESHMVDELTELDRYGHSLSSIFTYLPIEYAHVSNHTDTYLISDSVSDDRVWINSEKTSRIVVDHDASSMLTELTITLKHRMVSQDIAQFKYNLKYIVPDMSTFSGDIQQMLAT